MSQNSTKINTEKEEQYEAKIEIKHSDSHETNVPENDKMENKELVPVKSVIHLESNNSLHAVIKEVLVPKFSAHDIRVCEKIIMETKSTPSGSSVLLGILNYNFEGLDKNYEKSLPKYHMRRQFFRKPPEYWTQIGLSSGRDVPDGASPLSYEPDRNIFLLIVFIITFVMLAITAGFVYYVYNDETLSNLFQRHSMYIVIGGSIVMIGMNYIMVCTACARRPPCNFVCLFIALIVMSCIAACITARYRTDLIFLALICTLAVFILCMILACTSFDFTSFLLYVMAFAMAFFALSVVILIMKFALNQRMKTLTIIMLIVGTLLNVAILVIELQMILGGRTVELSEDDYALGAYMLYTSVVDIFLKLVQLFGIFDED